MRFAASVLSLAVIWSGTVYAEEPAGREIVSYDLNVAGRIACITKPENGDREAARNFKELEENKKWKGTKLCFGRWGDLVMTYRVLDPMTTDYSGENGDVKTMLLDCDVAFTQLPYMEDENAVPSWEDSYVRAWLNGEEFLCNEECFTELEREAIISSTKREPLESDSPKVSVTRDNFFTGPTHYRYLEFAPLAGDRIFLLDSKELTNAEYGYHPAEVGYVYTDVEYTNKSKMLYKEKEYYSWDAYWVRTNLIESTTNDVTTESSAFIFCNIYGNFVTGSRNAARGVSPAMNIDLSHVLFAGSDEEGFVYLTLKNGTAVTKAERGDVGNGPVTPRGGFVNLQNIGIEGEYGVAPDNLWAMVADEEGHVYNCERMMDAVEGESLVRIPEGLSTGHYRLYVFYMTEGFPTSYACLDLDAWIEVVVENGDLEREKSEAPHGVYIVKEGDSLWKVAERFCAFFYKNYENVDRGGIDRESIDYERIDKDQVLCQYVAYLWQTNREMVGEDPNHIEPGMELRLFVAP